MIKKLAIACLGLAFCVNTAFALNEKHTVKVLESKTAGAYTYLKVEENGKQFWAAVMKTDVQAGETIVISEQIVMKNFNSKALNETFDEIMFAELPKDKKIVTNTDAIHSIHGNMIKEKSKDIKPDIQFNEGLVISKEPALKASISDLYTKKDEYKNKNVTIVGHVLQVSNKVMGNTWIKIYDGKDSVIYRSPNEDEKLEVGDKVEATATINTDVDFGFGYNYEVLGVNANFKIINTKEK